MKNYDLVQATKPFDLFVEDLSTWYLRRSRDRLKDGDIEAKQTLYYVLKITTQLFAPFMPFIAEDIWFKLKLQSDLESVHLSDFFMDIDIQNIDVKTVEEMQKVREVVTLGLQARQKEGIPVRQPLNRLEVRGSRLQVKYNEIIKEELNVKEIMFTEGEELKVELDLHITEELRAEGQYRELVRAIQDIRKKNGLNPSDIITLVVETNVNGK
jgi:isoleucyl-tRNA synthetase